jgi:iron complex outermembrane receptor protein
MTPPRRFHQITQHQPQAMKSPRHPHYARTVQALAVCAALFAGLSSQAQTAPAPKPDEATVVLNPFVVISEADNGYRAGNSVSATRINTPIKDLPFQVTAFTKEFITDIGTRELADIVKYAPGATSGTDGFTTGNAAVAVRNFQSNPQRNGFAAPLFVDGSNIERVEIVKGPEPFAEFDASYGSYSYSRATVDINQPVVSGRVFFRFNGAWENELEYIKPFGGKIFSLNPTLLAKLTDNITLTLDYQYYSREEKPWALMRQSANVPTAAYLGPAFGSIFGHYVISDRRYSAANPNDFRSVSDDALEADLDIQHTENWSTRVSMNLDTYKNANRQTSRGDVVVNLPAGVLAALPKDPKSFGLAIPGLIEQYLNDPATTTAVSRRMQYFVNGYDRRTFQAETTGKVQLPFGVWKPLAGYQWFYGENPGFTATLKSALWNPDWDIRNRATWVDANNYNYSPQTYNTNANVHTEFDNKAFYTANQLSMLNDRLTFVLGARYSKVEIQQYSNVTGAPVGLQVTGKRTTPQFGVGYKLRPDVMLYASYSESFIIPPNNSLLRTHGIGDRVAKPQIGKGYEAGVKVDLMGGRMSGTLAVFDVKQDNYIINFKEFVSGVTLDNDYQDGNEISSRGAELELTYTPVNHWQVIFNASYCDTKYTAVGSADISYLKDTRPQYSARDRVNLWTRYSFTEDKVKGLWIGAGFNYTGKKAEISNNPWLYLPNQTIFDAVVGYDWKAGNRNWSAKIFWKNLTDEDESQTVRDRGQPSRVIADVTLRF